MTTPGDRSGTDLGPYRLVRRIGRGGMGEVYEAVDTVKDRTVALKLLPPALADDEQFRTRFLRESQTAAKLSDPHVIPIHDYGEIDGQLYLDMRIVRGQDLRGLINTGPVPPEQAVDVISQIAGALDAAHESGLTHRDVKPENILLDARGFAYLVDFGLVQSAGQSSLTATGAAIGSFNYMAPERFGTGAPVGPPSDVYALGCVLFECLTGAKPFGATSMEQIIAGHLHRALPTTGTAYDAVIARATAKNPAERHATAGELAEAARQTLAGRPPSSPVVPVPAAPITATKTAPPGTYDPTAQRVPSQPVPSQPVPAPPYPYPYPYPPAPPQQPARSVNVLLAAIAVIAVLTLVGLGTWFVLAGSDDDTTVTDANATVGQVPQTLTVTATSQAPAQAQETTVTATQTTGDRGLETTSATGDRGARPTGDLGLSTPISDPPCDGRTVAFVYNATTPGAYAQEVSNALAQFPGASYLRTDQSCSSLRQSLDGNPIYAVYYEGSSLSDTCSTKARIGGETYARKLDDSTPVGVEIC
ncbi:MAG: serine/threonine-protein kinase [Gordonia sp. (in: high G+C Gram-positive bacteria)]|uniref:serine/threonine-protein kinase n=1 Tax=Gordonia sp. (in: high G+C Gram-positive bacteria) TaxID=84139 RepID=UPI0039E5DC46